MFMRVPKMDYFLFVCLFVFLSTKKSTKQQENDATIDSTLRKYRESDTAVAVAPPPARRRQSPAEAATAAAAAAATNAGFVAGSGAAASDGKDEARLIVLERCGALVRSYGARKQAIAVDNLLESMEKAGVRMNARFLNSALVRFVFREGRERGRRRRRTRTLAMLFTVGGCCFYLGVRCARVA